MRPTHLVTLAAVAGACIGAGLWSCLAGGELLWIGTVGILTGVALHVTCMVVAERTERADGSSS